MRQDAPGEVLGGHARAVVYDADELRPALLDGDLDPLGPGVQAVLGEFLDDAGGPFNHLAGGDFIDQQVG